MSTSYRRLRIILVTILMLTLALVNITPVAAEDVPTDPLPEAVRGTVYGTGTHFEVTDSDYLNVVLDSLETISLSLSSFPDQILIEISPVSSTASTQITLSGLIPLTTFYLYEDDLIEATSFTTDTNGYFVFAQDLTTNHLVTIQPQKSTKFVTDDVTGGDCTLIGTWNISTKTCTLTGNVNDTIQIYANDITLDGNGYTISHTAYGIFIKNQSGVTIKNLNITSPSTGSGVGIILSNSFNSTIEGVNVSNKFYGLQTSHAHDNLIIGNSFSNNSYGMYTSNPTYNNTISNNTIAYNTFWGITINKAYNNTFTGNTISNHQLAGLGGVFFSLDAWENHFYNNTIVDNYFGMFNYFAWDNQIYNNNFVNNDYQAIQYRFDNIWNKATPDGGNYWSDFDEPGEGCDDTNSDNFCDAPRAILSSYTSPYDNLPWTTQNGWANQPPTAVAGGPYLGAVDTTILFNGSESYDPDGDLLSETWTADGGVVNGFTFTAGSVPGIFDVCLTVNDGTVESDPDCTIVVIYDPNGGFVTGGGWIDSPAGAFVADINLTGKATFGFVSKYKKGASTPTGQTEFQFKVGELDFHSVSYEWLVVAGQDKAKYKGSGTINNDGNFGFMLTAVDNGNSGDTFRIKIWDQDNADALVYDNQIGSEDESYTGTVIGGGNIKVHDK